MIKKKKKNGGNIFRFVKNNITHVEGFKIVQNIKFPILKDFDGKKKNKKTL